MVKYVASHATTRELLQKWAGETPLTTSNFFFWYLGTEIQKSQEGLSRGLLYKILDSDRSLIPKLLPTLWAATYYSEADLSTPSSAELQQAFKFLSLLPNHKRKFCFFIDGLDEYSGKPINGVTFLQTIAMNSNVKILLSSRPIQACVQAFSRRPKLYLQDLTAGDIETYITQTLQVHPHMAALRGRDVSWAEGLRTELVKKASGVFLWVVLACKSVREGLDNFDRPSDLRKRIDELPPELETLFRHMLGNIESRYRDYAAKILRICHQNQLAPTTQRVSTLGLALVDEHDLEISKLPEARILAENGTFLTYDARREGLEERDQKCLVLEGRLRTACLGLVEVRRGAAEMGAPLEHDPWSSWNSTVPCFHDRARDSHQDHGELAESTVEFLHRTVFDFLNSGGSTELERLMKNNDTFDASGTLASISLHLTGVNLHTGPAREVHVDDVLSHAGNIRTDKYMQTELVLLRLHDLLLKHTPVTDVVSFQELPYSKVEEQVISTSEVPYRNFGEEVVTGRNLSRYWLSLLVGIERGFTSLIPVFQLELQDCGYDLGTSKPLLAHAIKPIFTKSARSIQSEPRIVEKTLEMVRWLLDSGCDPNEQFLDEYGKRDTPWHSLWKRLPFHPFDSRYIEVMDLFMEAGADLDTPLPMIAVPQTYTSDSPGGSRVAHMMGRMLALRPNENGVPQDWRKYLRDKVAKFKTKRSSKTAPDTNEETLDEGLQKSSAETKRLPRQLPPRQARARSLSPTDLQRTKIRPIDVDGKSEFHDHDEIDPLGFIENGRPKDELYR